MFNNHKKIKINKATLYFPAFFLLLFVSLLFVFTNSSDRDREEVLTQEDSINLKKEFTEGDVSFENIYYSKPIFHIDEPLEVQITIRNADYDNKKLWLGYSLLDPLGEWIDLPMKEVSLSAQETTAITVSTQQDMLGLQDNVSGSYTAVFALWDDSQISEDSKRLADIRIPDAFRFQHGIENFDSLNQEQWYSRRGVLGRSQLEPENVQLDDSMLHITLPAKTLKGGELQSAVPYHYGSYEISMQLPNAPSSITGFFLYKAPDFYHEIDIEIFNKKNTEVLFTTYYQGSIHHEAVVPLDFDPTAGFHRYRIDYYPEEIAFYIDGHLMQKWEDGFSTEPMDLFVNAWYPSWLEGTPSNEDQVLQIKWIRY